MKITNIETHLVTVPYIEPNALAVTTLTKGPSVIIQVFTDEGILGIGETRGFTHNMAIIESEIAPLVIGEDPFDVEKILLKYLHSAPALLTDMEGACEAMGGVEMALWDIMGKKVGKPVYKLIGGKFREKIPISAFMSLKSFDEIVEDARAAVKQGYKTIKIKVGRNADEDIALVAKIREVVGPQVELRVDANGSWAPGTAVRQARKLEKYDPQFIEQPVPRYDMKGLAYVRAKSRVPIAVCEGGLTLYRLSDIIRTHAADFISTDPLRLGGILMFKKAAHMAEAAGIPIVTHVCLLGISKAAWLHVCTSTPNVMYANDILASNGVGFRGAVDDLVNVKFEHKDGYLIVPEAPGLGVDLNEDSLKKYKEEHWEKVRWPGKEGVFTSPSY
jgi:L-alanine-DL-glutamate epimerase-like enolase superfamily enzyme